MCDNIPLPPADPTATVGTKGNGNDGNALFSHTYHIEFCYGSDGDVLDIVNIGLHFFLKDVRPMLPPVMNRSIVDA